MKPYGNQSVSVQQKSSEVTGFYMKGRLTVLLDVKNFWCIRKASDTSVMTVMTVNRGRQKEMIKSYQSKALVFLSNQTAHPTHETKYSRMDQVRFVKGSL